MYRTAIAHTGCPGMVGRKGASVTARLCTVLLEANTSSSVTHSGSSDCSSAHIHEYSCTQCS